ncbi:SIMPL domain-containing protein [uncultured Fibrobacter sp.]|uniref:SIMPL domain-containing protein n=1 Tax=uncultured Fibrobacter sp. TaxID=261512 RepID=UPI00261B9599|nr:SIMPL domain-containing protein [uncultured Fibrobacter sp.]
MLGKFFPFLILLLVLLGFIVVSFDKADRPSISALTSPSAKSSSVTPTVEVLASEQRKFEANEFLTVASIELHGRDKEILSRQMESRRQSVFEQMKKIDVDESEIEQNSVEMHKEWAYDKGSRSLTGYVMRQSFAIKSSSRSIAAAVIATLSAEMDVEIIRTSAGLKERDSLQNEIIRAVGKEALRKAESYAAGVGGKVGKVISLVGEGDGIVPARSRPMVKYATLGAVSNGVADESAVADSVAISASVRLVVELLQ